MYWRSSFQASGQGGDQHAQFITERWFGVERPVRRPGVVGAEPVHEVTSSAPRRRRRSGEGTSRPIGRFGAEASSAASMSRSWSMGSPASRPDPRMAKLCTWLVSPLRRHRASTLAVEADGAQGVPQYPEGRVGKSFGFGVRAVHGVGPIGGGGRSVASLTGAQEGPTGTARRISIPRTRRPTSSAGDGRRIRESRFKATLKPY